MRMIIELRAGSGRKLPSAEELRRAGFAVAASVEHGAARDPDGTRPDREPHGDHGKQQGQTSNPP